MIRLVAKLRRPSFPHPDDLERMRRVLWSAGYDAELVEIQRAWIDFSQNKHAVSWIYHENYDDEALLRVLLDHLEEKR